MGEKDGNAPKANEVKTRLVDIAEDTIGFGETEWHTFRDLLVRPRSALDAYMELGPTGGGRYKRPLGFYIALCGLLTFYLFLLGGFKGIIEAQPPETIDPWLERSGKSRESFISDVDGWMSVLGTPVLSVFYALVTAPLLMWWSGLDWRRGIRATFVLLNAWTVPIVLLGPLPYIAPDQAVSSLVLQGLLVVAFLRTGMGLWFRSWPVGVAKGAVLIVVLLIGSIIGMFPVLHLSLIAASLGN